MFKLVPLCLGALAFVAWLAVSVGEPLSRSLGALLAGG